MISRSAYTRPNGLVRRMTLPSGEDIEQRRLAAGAVTAGRAKSNVSSESYHLSRSLLCERMRLNLQQDQLPLHGLGSTTERHGDR